MKLPRTKVVVVVVVVGLLGCWVVGLLRYSPQVSGSSGHLFSEAPVIGAAALL